MSYQTNNYGGNNINQQSSFFPNPSQNNPYQYNINNPINYSNPQSGMYHQQNPQSMMINNNKINQNDKKNEEYNKKRKQLIQEARDKFIQEEIKLTESRKERDEISSKAELFSILVATDHLEKAFISDAIKAEDYTSLCNKLIAKYQTYCSTNSLEKKDVENFMKEYDFVSKSASERLIKKGVPATVEHLNQTISKNGGVSSKLVAETATTFVTLLDAIDMDQTKEEFYPLLTDLVEYVNKIPLKDLNPDREKLKKWIFDLSSMKAYEKLEEQQTIQFRFDIKSSYDNFHKNLESN